MFNVCNVIRLFLYASLISSAPPRHPWHCPLVPPHGACTLSTHWWLRFVHFLHFCCHSPPPSPEINYWCSATRGAHLFHCFSLGPNIK